MNNHAKPPSQVKRKILFKDKSEIVSPVIGDSNWKENARAYEPGFSAGRKCLSTERGYLWKK